MTKDEVEYLRRRATSKTQQAVKTGRLPKIAKNTKCVDCGDRATQYDHRDYYKPLEVEPVCRTCNAKRGPAYPVPTDWNEYGGAKWNSLDGGSGEDVQFNGRCLIDVDWFAVEIDLESARRAIDHDKIIAMKELARFPATYNDGTRRYNRGYREMVARRERFFNHK